MPNHTQPSRTKVVLSHKQGDVTITIDGPSPEVVAYLANVIREKFSDKEKQRCDSFHDQVMRRLGL